MAQAASDLSEDRQVIAELLRTRQDDGYEPPQVRISSEASGQRDLRLLSNRDSSVSVTRTGNTIAGLVCWTHLRWDSEQLGMPVAKLDLLVSTGGYQEAFERKSALLRMAAEECRIRGVRYLTARVGAADLSTIHALGRAGFDMIDGILTFSMKLEDAVRRPVANGIEVRLFQPRDLDQVLAIAQSAYTCDRFHVDRVLAPGVADRLYAAWVRRSCSGEEADAVVVAAKQGRVLSYVACKLTGESAASGEPSAGIIILVATAERARGQGVGSAAVQGALDWFREQGAQTAEVGTQMQNVAACRLYEQCGFRMSRMSLTFRRLL